VSCRITYIINDVPCCYKFYFLVLVFFASSVATCSFCSPRDVIDVAEGVDDHSLSVGALIADIADLITDKFPYKLRMSDEMN